MTVISTDIRNVTRWWKALADEGTLSADHFLHGLARLEEIATVSERLERDTYSGFLLETSEGNTVALKPVPALPDRGTPGPGPRSGGSAA